MIHERPFLSEKYIHGIKANILLGLPRKDIQSNPDYVSFLSQMRDIYQQVWRWHGTGRYQYLPPDYYGVQDVLASMHMNGLVPQYDPLDYVKGPMYSIKPALIVKTN